MTFSARLGEPQALPQRPIHNSIDATGAYALTSYNNPSNLTVHRINTDGTVGAEVPQASKIDLGIFAHQILAMPGNRSVIMVTRGNPQSYHVRTFSIDPSGRMLVAASIADMLVRDGDAVRRVPAALSVFRIAADGKLEFVRKYDVELGGKFQWWSGFVGLPPA